MTPAEIYHVVKQFLNDVLADSTRTSEQESPHHLHQVQDQEQWQQQRLVGETRHLFSADAGRIQEQLPAAHTDTIRLLSAAVWGMAAYALRVTRTAAAAPAAYNGPAAAVTGYTGKVELSICTSAPYFISQTQHVQGSRNPMSSSTAETSLGRAPQIVRMIRANAVSLQQVQAGLDRFIASLRPTLEENITFHAAFTILKEACIAAAAQLPSAGHPFGRVILAGVKIAGSYAKETHLSKGSDLDVLVQLKCPPEVFQRCRTLFLGVLDMQLCQRVALESSGNVAGSSSKTSADGSSILSTGASLDQLLAAEWQLGPSGCVPAYYVRYLVSGLQVDVQVARCRGTVEEMRANIRHRIEETIAEAGAGEAGTDNAEASATPSGAASSSASNISAPSNCTEAKRSSLRPTRQRVTDLAELQTDMLTDIEVNHGVLIATTVRDVIRVLKALVANGLTSENHQEVSPVVPGSVLELIVVWVFDLSTEQHARGGPGITTLNLLLAVLAANSEHLRPVEEGQIAPIIAVPRMYSWADLLHPGINQHWGCGRLFTPYIINSCDPVYNCTKFINFRNWDGFAQGCHRLLNTFSDVLANPAGYADAWQVLCRRTCLEAAVATYDSG